MWDNAATSQNPKAYVLFKEGFALVRITLWRLEDARSKQHASALRLFDSAHTTYKSTSTQDLAVIEHHYMGCPREF